MFQLILYSEFSHEACAKCQMHVIHCHVKESVIQFFCMKFHFQFSVCYVSPTELDRFLNDEFEAFIEDLKLSAVTSDFDDEIEPQGLYFCFKF